MVGMQWFKEFARQYGPRLSFRSSRRRPRTGALRVQAGTVAGVEWLEDRTFLSGALSVIDINQTGVPVYERTAAVGSKLYFMDTDTQHGWELHVLDTTTNTTSLVIDINPGLGDSNVGEYGGFTVVGNNLYFTAYDPINGKELRWIDTTETLPVLHTLDILAGRESSYLNVDGEFMPVGTKLYFAAYDVANGYALRWIDTTEAVPILHTLGGVTNAGTASGYEVVGSSLYFSALDSTNGWELRWIDTTEVTPTLHTLDISTGISSSNAGQYGGFTALGNILYFTAQDSSTGYELRWIDTTEVTPTLHTLDISSGTSSSFAGQSGGFTTVGNYLYFTAQDQISGKELRWIDTTEATPTLHTLDIYAGNSSSNAGFFGGFAAVGSRMYFTAIDSASGAELRWIDATEANSTIHTLDIYSGASSSIPGQYGGFKAVGDTLYFTAQDLNYGLQLRWISTTETAPALHTISISGGYLSDAGRYGGFAVLGRNLYFTARDTTNGYELRWIDTAEANPTVSTVDIYASGSGSNPGEIGGFLAVGNHLYFTTLGPAGRELQWIDTDEVTPTLRTLDIFAGSGSSNAGQYGGFTAVGNKLYFTAQDSTSGYELRWIDTTESIPTFHTLDIYAGGIGSNAGQYGGFIATGNVLYFSAYDSSNGYELRWIDTTEAIPTVHTLDIYAGSQSSYPGRYGGFTAVGSKLYFTAQDSTSGDELRWIDVTEATPALHTLNIYTGTSSSYAGQYGGFTAVGNNLYFTAADLTKGTELQWIDTTEVTPTLHTLDVYAGINSSYSGQYGGFKAVGNKLYFTGNDSSGGNELRWIDTTEVIPTLHTLDIYAGTSSSNSGQYGGFVVAGDNLYFTAQDSTNGTELRWIETTAAAPTLHTLDIYSGSANSSNAGQSGGFIAVGDTLYFAAKDSAGTELRWINTTEVAPTLHTVDIYVGIVESSPGQYGGFMAVGNKLFFSANNPGFGTELFVLDITPSTAPNLIVDDLAYMEGDNGGAPVVIDAGAAASDPNGDADWNGGTLTIQITANAEATDEISVGDIGNILVNRATGEISSSGVHFATATVNSASATDGAAVIIQFNANATNVRVEDLVRAIAYRATSNSPTAGDRTVTFTATDNTSLAGVDTATITVTAVNNLPSVSLTPSVVTLPENATTTPRIKVADIVIADDNLGTNFLSLSGSDAALFEIDGTELFLKAGTILDFETNPAIDVTVNVDDSTLGGTPDDSKPLSFSVTDVNEHPTVALSNAVTTLPEDQSIASRSKVADITVTDDGLGTNNLSLTGTDAALFEIFSGALYLKAGTILDFETNPVLDVTVNVDDPALGGTPDDSKPLSITVTDVNEPPTVTLSNTLTTLPENQSIASRLKVADITVTDDALGTNNLSLTGTDAALFEIFSGALYLKAGTVLDFETNPVLDVTVNVDDPALGGTPDNSKPLSITVSDVNEAPTVTVTQIVSSVVENAATTPRIKVGTIAITDDALGTNVLSLSGADAAIFEISGTDLYLKAGAILDVVTNPVLDVTVNVDDAVLGGNPDASRSLSIAVTRPLGRPDDLVLYDPATGRWRMGVSDGTVFTWTNGPKWNPASGWTIFTGDYNGDGLIDGIGITSQNAVFFARNNGNGTMTSVSAGSFSSLESFQHIMVGDFNGDNRTDLLVQQATHNTTPLPGSWFVKSWNGTAFTTSFYGRWDAAGWIGFGVGDVNQDGVNDIVGVRNAEGAVDRVNWLYGISNVIPDTSRRFYAQFAGAFSGRFETAGWSSILVGDWDNDGRADVAASRNDGRFVYGTATGGPTPYAAIGANRLVNSTGPLFSPSAFSGPFLAGDFNGDGRDDILTRQSNNKNLWVALTSASAPTSATVSGWGPWDDTKNWSGAAVGDFNGDGLDDYVSVDLTASHAWGSLSTGSAFQSASDFGLITGPDALVGPLRLWRGIVN